MGMNIPTSEYEQRRHIFEMCKWINEKCAEMQTFPDFETIYFERQGANVKKLTGEAMPLASLGLYFYRPANDVFLKCLAGNQNYDAELNVSGWNNFDIKVEVTTVETDETNMRRKALSRDGFVFMTGIIKRAGRIIISEAEMVDMDVENTKWIDLAFERYLKKVEHSYDEDTAILVSFSSFRHIPLRYRAKLIEKTERHFLVEKPQIHGVSYSYGDDFVVDGVKVKRRRSA